MVTSFPFASCGLRSERILLRRRLPLKWLALQIFAFSCTAAIEIRLNFRFMNTLEHTLEFRIYLEDTDAQGIVYHANYLRYFERGRSDLFESFGVPLDQVARPDCRLVVYETRIKFRRPAFLGDRIEVLTSMQRVSDYRLTFLQQVRRKGEDAALVSGEVDVVAIDQNGALKELPPTLGAA
jgi:acyl-CoA thioester hydrolase